jgi:predicted nucleic-acid-binding protein
VAALDANILVRFIVEDDAAQLVAAKKLIRRCVLAGESLFIPVTVALELEWVLRSNFKFEKGVVIQTFNALLSAVELRFESESSLESALRLYAEASADFSDCMHIALVRGAGETPLWTFDKAASKVDGARWLSSSAV